MTAQAEPLADRRAATGDRYPPLFRVRLLHLAALWAYAVAQPVFALLQGTPEFLAVRGLTRIEIAAFAVAVAVLPPLLVVAVERLVSLASPWLGNVLHLLFVLAFLVPISVQLARLVDTGADMTLALMVAVPLLGAALYVTARAVRLFLSFSIVLPVLGLLGFVWTMPQATADAQAATLRPAARPPIILVVLDELPLSSLLTPAGHIDEDRYPAFARLAGDSTWYPSATTLHDYSRDAVPAILTGRLSKTGSLPIFADHPQNLFTLLGSAYALRVYQEEIRLCPESLCDASGTSFTSGVGSLFGDLSDAYLAAELPSSLQTLRHVIRGRGALDARSRETIDDFESMLAGIGDGSRATLHFAHLLLPHAPWRFLPSGREYSGGTPGFSDAEVWGESDWLVVQGFQRHLLQLSFTDRLLGRLLQRLEQHELYDDALVIVLADHGASFRVGAHRRTVTRANVADIANVPLFVKYPGQEAGAIDRRAARTTDILPTIADVLGGRVPWTVDGRSLLRPAAPRGRLETYRVNGEAVVFSLEDLERARAATIRRKTALFGEGRQSLYRIGQNTDLLGMRVRAGASNRRSAVRLDSPGAFGDVRLSSSLLPVHVTGVVLDRARRDELAVAVNGRIVALAEPFTQAGVPRFQTLVPESSLREGRNRVDVHGIAGAGAGRRLVWLGSSHSP